MTAIAEAIKTHLKNSPEAHGGMVLIADFLSTVKNSGGCPTMAKAALLKLHKAQNSIRLQRLDLRSMYADKATEINGAEIRDGAATYDLIAIR